MNSQEWIIVHPFNHCSHTFRIKPKFMILVSHFSPFNIDHPSKVTTGSTPCWVRAPNPISTALFRVVGAYLGFHWSNSCREDLRKQSPQQTSIDHLDHVDLLYNTPRIPWINWWIWSIDVLNQVEAATKLSQNLRFQTPAADVADGSRGSRVCHPHRNSWHNFAAWQTKIFGHFCLVRK